MNSGIRGSRRLGLLLIATIVAVVVAACGSSSTGSSSGSAQTLLKQTFGNSHNIKSGVLGFTLTVNPSGSSTLTTPITLSLNGPFQSRGTGKLPASDFTIGISALGQHGALGVISTGTNGYVTLQGSSYQLPPADFQRLESSFSSVQSTAGASGQSGLSALGINPLHWLKRPSIVGNATVGGAPTTHIRAGVDVAALLSDLNKILAKTANSSAASSAGIPTTISPATRQKIAATIKNATVDIWTGTSDKTLRKLALDLNLPVSGQFSTLLGGLSSAGIAFSLQYASLNQAQTIPSPTNVRPYSEFTAKLKSVIAALEGSFGAGGLGSPGSSSGQSSSTAAPSSPTSAKVQKYTGCIQQAAGDVAKMQKCASLLNGK
jgi:hypothetical protein